MGRGWSGRTKIDDHVSLDKEDILVTVKTKPIVMSRVTYIHTNQLKYKRNWQVWSQQTEQVSIYLEYYNAV